MSNEQAKGPIEIVATFDQDSKRFHRFTINAGQAVTGSLYVPKGAIIPGTVTIRLTTKGEVERNGRQ